MTYTIPPDSPRAVLAAAFGRELLTAMTARDVPRNELGRLLGLGHSTIWHYLHGRTLPKVATARTLAQALDWPKLAQIVVDARTRTCRRPSCGRAFINDIGSEAKRYCSATCARIADTQKQAETRARSAGQTGSHQTRRAHVQRLRAAVVLADGRASVLADAVAAMCRSCEPEGLCRDAGCPLRGVSPLSLAGRSTAMPRTTVAIRAEARRKAGPGQRAAMLRRHSEPGFSERLATASRAARARQTPEEHEAWVASIRAGKARQHATRRDPEACRSRQEVKA